MHCPDCKKLMIEIKEQFYPKPTGERVLILRFFPFYWWPKKWRFEKRFYCSQCQKEWTYDNAFKSFAEVPSFAQYLYNPKTKHLEPNTKEAGCKKY